MNHSKKKKDKKWNKMEIVKSKNFYNIFCKEIYCKNQKGKIKKEIYFNK